MSEAGRLVRQHMGLTERLAWYTLVICTCGILYPFYRARKRHIESTTVHYTA